MLATALLLAGVVSIPAPQGLEARLLDDARDGKLDSMSLLDAALVASGVPDDDVKAEAARARAALAPAVARARRERDPHRRGEVLLRALHDTVFRRYESTASEIDEVIHTGSYNCLSSALLFVVAADGLLDDPTAMVTRHHAYARVRVAGRAVDVETTTRNGFDADRKKLMTPEYVKKIAGPDTTPRALLDDLTHPEELPLLSLVAAVYSNRAVGLVQKGALDDAAVALDRAQHLASGKLRSRTAAWRGGMLNDGAIELASQGRLDDARALLELARQGTEGETRALLTQNLASLHLKLADRALAQKDWTGALLHVAAAQKLGARDADTGPLRARAESALAALEGNDARCARMTASRDAASCFAALALAVRDREPERALQCARRAWALDDGAPNAERALFFSLVKVAKKESDAHRCDAVERLVREAAAHTAALDGQRWSAAETMGSCWAAAGDEAFDKKDWARAGGFYERARAHLPREPRLRQNLAAVDVNRAIERAGAGDCDEARGLAWRARRADPSLADKAVAVLEQCAAVRAHKAAVAGDWAAAAAELRRGLLDAPTSAVLDRDLKAVLHNQAAALLQARDCDAARALVPDLAAHHDAEAQRAIAGACPP